MAWDNAHVWPPSSEYLQGGKPPTIYVNRLNTMKANVCAYVAHATNLCDRRTEKTQTHMACDPHAGII